MNKKKLSNVSHTLRTQLHQNDGYKVLSKAASLASLARLAAKRVARQVESRRAKQRRKWLEHFQKYRNARLTCRHFGISPSTFYLWKNKFNPQNLLSLEDNTKNRKPHKLRQPKFNHEHIDDITKLKYVNQKLGKVLITKILKVKGHKISQSTVSRILSNLKKIRGRD